MAEAQVESLFSLSCRTLQTLCINLMASVFSEPCPAMLFLSYHRIISYPILSAYHITINSLCILVHCTMYPSWKHAFDTALARMFTVVEVSLPPSSRTSSPMVCLILCWRCFRPASRYSSAAVEQILVRFKEQPRAANVCKCILQNPSSQKGSPEDLVVLCTWIED